MSSSTYTHAIPATTTAHALQSAFEVFPCFHFGGTSVMADDVTHSCLDAEYFLWRILVGVLPCLWVRNIQNTR